MQAVITDLRTKLEPAHTALLVIDVQNDFCAPGGYIQRVKGKDVSANAAVAAPIEVVVEAARRAAVLPVWVRAIYDPQYLPVPMLAKQHERGLSGEGLCLEGSWGAEFYRLAPGPEELVVDKHRYSAFSGTALDALLRERSIRTLVLTGVATNVCIESTLREGFMNGYYIVVPEDCVASHHPVLHQATLENVRQSFGDVVSSADLLSVWSRRSDAEG